MLIWDVPTRLFHWLLVICIAGAWWTSRSGHTQVHAWFGYTALALLLFRLAWGVAGSQTARFAAFLGGPRPALDHLRTLVRRGELVRHAGHNPLGGYAVIGLLTSSAVQAATGLFLYDDALFWGPLNDRVPEGAAEALRLVHAANFNVLLGLIGLHLAALAFYGLVKRQDLLLPMITGRAPLPEGAEQPRAAPMSLALLFAAAAVGAVAALVRWG